jgi:hypothetical protein
VGTFLIVAVVVAILVIAGIAFGARPGKKHDGNEASGGYYGSYGDGHHDHGGGWSDGGDGGDGGGGD